LVELLLWLTWPFGACLHPWSLQEVLHWIEGQGLNCLLFVS
jgi:hypothetical protein